MARLARYAPVGRGFRHPFRFSAGGVEWNMPRNPTDAQLSDAIRRALDFLMTTPVGSVLMASDAGSHAVLQLFGRLTEGQVDAVVRAFLSDVARNIPYVRFSVASITATESRITVNLSFKVSSGTRSYPLEFPMDSQQSET